MAKISGFYQTLWNGYIAVYKYSKLKTLKNNSTPQYYTGPRPYTPFEKKKKGLTLKSLNLPHQKMKYRDASFIF